MQEKTHVAQYLKFLVKFFTVTIDMRCLSFYNSNTFLRMATLLPVNYSVKLHRENLQNKSWSSIPQDCFGDGTFVLRCKRSKLFVATKRTLNRGKPRRIQQHGWEVCCQEESGVPNLSGARRSPSYTSRHLVKSYSPKVNWWSRIRALGIPCLFSSLITSIALLALSAGRAHAAPHTARPAKQQSMFGTTQMYHGTYKQDPFHMEREKTRYGSDGFLTETDFKSHSAGEVKNWLAGSILYRLDVLLERYPLTSFALLGLITFLWVLLGAVVWFTLARAGLKRTAMGRPPTLANCLWAAWSCVATASTQTRETGLHGRLLALCLSLGGLLCYSVLTGTVSASVRVHYESMQAGREQRPVLETGHVVVAGENAHLGALLRQLDRSRFFARKDGQVRGRQTVVVVVGESSDSLSHGSFNPKCPDLNILVRRGDLNSHSTFHRMAAPQAAKIVLLANHDDAHLSDAKILSSMLALSAGKLKESKTKPDIVVEVSKPSSANLIRSLSGGMAEPVMDMTNRLLAQCMCQSGLTKVYRKLMRHTGTVINLRNFPEIAGLPFGRVWRGFDGAVVLGLVRDGAAIFQPSAWEVLRPGDKLMLVADKHSCRLPPTQLVEEAKQLKMEEEAPRHLISEGGGWDDDAVVVNAETTLLQNYLPSSQELQSRVTDFRLRGGFSGTVGQEDSGEENIQGEERILLLGWRYGAAETCFGLDQLMAKGCEMVVLADTPESERELIIRRKFQAYGQKEPRNLKIRHVRGNVCSRTDVRNALLSKNDSGKVPKATRIVVVAEEEVKHLGPETDNRSIYSALLAKDVRSEQSIALSSLVAELVDRRLGQQVRGDHSHH